MDDDSPRNIPQPEFYITDKLIDFNQPYVHRSIDANIEGTESSESCDFYIGPQATDLLVSY